MEALFFQESPAQKTLFYGSDINPRKYSGNGDRLSNYKITVIGVIIMISQNFTHQKYHFYDDLCKKFRSVVIPDFLIHNMLSREGFARIKMK